MPPSQWPRDPSEQIDALTREGFPNEFNKVSELYEPAVFLAWILVAYSVAAQHFSPLEGRMYWNMDKDLAATVLYPAIAAGHMLVMMTHYPGPRGEVWATTYNTSRPDAAPIWAAMRVCNTGLGINLVLYAFLNKSRIRKIIVAMASLWIYVAVCVAGPRRHDPGPIYAIIGPLQGLFAALALAIGPIGAVIPIGILLVLVSELWRKIHHVFGRSSQSLCSRLREALTFDIRYILSYIFLAFFVTNYTSALILPALFYLSMAPITNVSLGEFSQAMTILLACLNLAFAVRGLILQYRKTLWTFLTTFVSETFKLVWDLTR